MIIREIQEKDNEQVESLNECYLETFSNMVAANKFYKKNGFIQLDKPLVETEHYACDVWYIKSL